MEKEEEPDTSSSSTTKRSRSINSNSRPSPSSSPDGKKKPRPTSPPSSSTSSSNTNYSIFQGKSEKRNSNPPGLFTAGLRRNGAEDKDGKRSLSLEDYKTLLKQHSIEVVVDMRVGRGKTAKCERTLEGKGCNISEPKWACDCSIEGVHNKLKIEYLFRGTTIRTNKGGEPSGYNLGGTNINCLCRNDEGVEERKWIKNGGQLRRAMMDSNNTKGKDCENDAKKTISGVVYDEHAKKEVRERLGRHQFHPFLTRSNYEARQNIQPRKQETCAAHLRGGRASQVPQERLGENLR